MALDTAIEPNSVGGADGFVDQVNYAYGAKVPHQFTGITYAGNTPTTASGITFQLLVKTARDDADGSALIDVTNASLTITASPLVVGYDVDTQTAGFTPNTKFFGELWVVDTTYGTHLVHEWHINLSDPIKNTFP